VANPIPLLPPVMTAVFPCRRPVVPIAHPHALPAGHPA
jgi:hypothetical protein